MSYRRGAYAIVVNQDGQVLLVRPKGYAKGQWTFPGGGIDVGENEQQAAERELFEETGLSSNELYDAFVTSQTAVYAFPKPMRFFGTLYTGQAKRHVVFRTRRTAEEPLTLNDEIDEARWVLLAEIERYLKFPNQYELAVRALREAGAAL